VLPADGSLMKSPASYPPKFKPPDLEVKVMASLFKRTCSSGLTAWLQTYPVEKTTLNCVLLMGSRNAHANL